MAAASVSPGDGGAWLEGDATLAVACDAMIIPVVVGDIDPGAIEQLITYRVQYDRIRGYAADDADCPGGPGTPGGADGPDSLGGSDGPGGA